MAQATDVASDTKPAEVVGDSDTTAPTVQEQKAARAAMKAIRAPVEGSVRLGCAISAVAAIVGLAPFVGLVGVVDELLAEPLDRGALVAWCVFVVVGLVARTLLNFAAQGIAHKTTITRLIARFWDTDEGTVRVGGADVRDQRIDDLMAQVAVVFQDVYLFDDTLEANIRLGWRLMGRAGE